MPTFHIPSNAPTGEHRIANLLHELKNPADRPSYQLAKSLMADEGVH